MPVRPPAPQTTLLDPAGRHRAAVARSLGWADEAAKNGDHADALAWLCTIEAIGDQLPDGYQAKRETWITLARPRPQRPRSRNPA